MIDEEDGGFGAEEKVEGRRWISGRSGTGSRGEERILILSRKADSRPGVLSSSGAGQQVFSI
jgi:hypothetical protein